MYRSRLREWVVSLDNGDRVLKATFGKPAPALAPRLSQGGRQLAELF